MSNLASATPSENLPEHNVEDLIFLFDSLFAESENTRLLAGGDEPIYLPADNQCSYHRIIFAHGFFSSALHEISHWLIAGEARRQLVDFGYWYEPDGRTAEQQKNFEQVEIKPQAIEWILSSACQKTFRVSVDNLSGQAGDGDSFKQAVYQQLLEYCRQGLNPRAERLRTALSGFYQSSPDLECSGFKLTDLG